VHNRRMASEQFALVVQLWAAGGDVAALAAFERRVVPLLARHGGAITCAVRCAPGGGDDPHEVHVVTFPDRAAYDAYRRDPDTAALAGERARVIARSVVTSGHPVRYARDTRAT
jgi:hypothetical protein